MRTVQDPWNYLTRACFRIARAGGAGWRVFVKGPESLMMPSMWHHTRMADDDRVRGPQGPGGRDGGPGTGVIVKPKTRTKKPSMYKVLMLNDDYTPMEFVVLVLERFFNKGHDEATRIMLHVHQKGIGVCGVYTYEVAETKVTQTMDLARQHQHPLQCTLERD